MLMQLPDLLLMQAQLRCDSQTILLFNHQLLVSYRLPAQFHVLLDILVRATKRKGVRLVGLVLILGDLLGHCLATPAQLIFQP